MIDRQSLALGMLIGLLTAWLIDRFADLGYSMIEELERQHQELLNLQQRVESQGDLAAVQSKDD